MLIEAARLAMDLCVLDTAINAVSAGFRCLGSSSKLQVPPTSSALIAMIWGFLYCGSVVSGICHVKISTSTHVGEHSPSMPDPDQQCPEFLLVRHIHMVMDASRAAHLPSMGKAGFGF